MIGPNKPKFTLGEAVINISASENNPRRNAFFVREVLRVGKFNGGLWYELTDGKNDFWDTDPLYVKARSDIVFQANGRIGTENVGQNHAGCQTCGEEDISPNIEAFEISGQILCDECAEEVFEDNGQFGMGA